MHAWEYGIYFPCVEQDLISLVHFVHAWDILVNIQNKFHISAHHVLLILYIIQKQCLFS